MQQPEEKKSGAVVAIRSDVKMSKYDATAQPLDWVDSNIPRSTYPMYAKSAPDKPAH